MIHAPPPTLARVREAAHHYKDQFGIDAIRALVGRFGADRCADLDPMNYRAFIEACYPPPALIPAGVKPTPYLPVDADRFNRLTEYVKAARAKFYSPVRVGLDWGHAEPMVVTTWHMPSDDAIACKHPTLLVAHPMVPGVWVPVEVKK